MYVFRIYVSSMSDVALFQENEATNITGKLVCAITLATLLVPRHSKTVPWYERSHESSEEGEGF
jgi:hypothetical protein